MNINSYIGLPVEVVKNELDKASISYKIIESSDIQKSYDTILVVKITQKDGYVEIVTDKFLLNV